MGRGKFFFTVVSASGGSGFIHGFHSGLFNTLTDVILDWYIDIEKRRHGIHYRKEDLYLFRSIIWSCFGFGGFIGSFFICCSVVMCGRKLPLVVHNGINLIALFFMSFAFLSRSYETLIVARIFLGICAGISSGATVIYLVEIAPFCLRGIAGSFYYLMTAASIAFAYVIGMDKAMGKKYTWPLIFIMCFVPSFAQIGCMFLCPESPKLLFINNNDTEAAIESLEWMSGDDVDEEIDDLDEEKSLLKEIGPVPFKRLFKDTKFRTPLIISACMLFGQQLSGFPGLLYYSNDLYRSLDYTKNDPTYLTISFGLCNLLGSVVCTCLIDRVGRKPLILVSFGGMLISQMLYTMALILASYKNVIPSQIAHLGTAFLLLFGAFFGLGAGPIPWFYVAEICNHLARPVTVCIVVTIGWFVHFLVAFSFVFLKYYLGVYVFVIYFAFNSIVGVFLYFTMRETVDLTSVDITQLFHN